MSQVRVKALGAVAALSMVGLLSTAPMARADQTVVALFDIRMGTMQVGRGTFEARIGDGVYSVGVAARVVGIARLAGGGEGTASASGTFSGGRLFPTAYRIDNTAGELNNAIRISMRGNAVVRESVDPPSVPLPDRIPIHDYHRRGVIDPLSGFVFPAMTSDLTSPANCNRTLRVYDGRGRYDIALTHARTVQVQSGDYEGPALVCRARYAAVAGHRRGAATGAGESYNDMEAWIIPVRGTQALVVYRMQVGTSAGNLVVEANRITIMPSSMRQAARGSLVQAQAGE